MQSKLEARSYEFDRVFGPEATQADVFAHVRPLVESAVAGFQACVLAYGSTGSGKTHTIMGDDSAAHAGVLAFGAGGGGGGAAGLVRRTVNTIFARAAERGDLEFQIDFSYVELYQSTFRDLLWEPSRTAAGGWTSAPKMALRDSPTDGVYLEGSHTLRTRVESADEVMRLVRLGNENRAVGTTDLNEHSSRSHAIATLDISSRRRADQGGQGGGGAWRRGRLHIVDLAGSERLSMSGAADDPTSLAETQSINLSLTVLADCLNALATRSSDAWLVPYRNSKLTHLLRDSLGGSARTLMIAHARPTAPHYRQTLVTLHYAQRARSVQITPRMHLDFGDAASSSASSADLQRMRAMEELQARLDARTMEVVAARAAADHAAAENTLLRRRLDDALAAVSTAEDRVRTQLAALVTTATPTKGKGATPTKRRSNTTNSSSSSSSDAGTNPMTPMAEEDEGAEETKAGKSGSMQVDEGTDTATATETETATATAAATTTVPATAAAATQSTPVGRWGAGVGTTPGRWEEEVRMHAERVRAAMAETQAEDRQAWMAQVAALEQRVLRAEAQADPAMFSRLEEALADLTDTRRRLFDLQDAIRDAEATASEERERASEMERRSLHEVESVRAESARAVEVARLEALLARVDRARADSQAAEAAERGRQATAEATWVQIGTLVARAESLVAARVSEVVAAQRRHVARFAATMVDASVEAERAHRSTAQEAHDALTDLASLTHQRARRAVNDAENAAAADLEARIAKAQADAQMQGLSQAMRVISTAQASATATAVAVAQQQQKEQRGSSRSRRRRHGVPSATSSDASDSSWAPTGDDVLEARDERLLDALEPEDDSVVQEHRRRATALAAAAARKKKKEAGEAGEGAGQVSSSASSAPIAPNAELPDLPDLLSAKPAPQAPQAPQMPGTPAVAAVILDPDATEEEKESAEKAPKPRKPRKPRAKKAEPAGDEETKEAMEEGEEKKPEKKPRKPRAKKAEGAAEANGAGEEKKPRKPRAKKAETEKKVEEKGVEEKGVEEEEEEEAKGSDEMEDVPKRAGEKRERDEEVENEERGETDEAREEEVEKRMEHDYDLPEAPTTPAVEAAPKRRKSESPALAAKPSSPAGAPLAKSVAPNSAPRPQPPKQTKAAAPPKAVKPLAMPAMGFSVFGVGAPALKLKKR